MICPNCDGILNINGCQACGWKTGDPFPAHRLTPDSAHPLKPGAAYPLRTGETKTVPVVVEQPPVEIPPAPEPPQIERESAPVAVEPAPEPIADPLTKTVQ